MQTEELIKQKFQELYIRELEKIRELYLTRKPLSCINNITQRVKGNGTFGFCKKEEILSKTKNNLYVCNEIETAVKCQCYECKFTEEEILNEYHKILKTPSVCGQKFPKLAMLIWFLQNMPEDNTLKNRFSRLIAHVKEIVKNIYSIVKFKWY
jgi:hypothetical protein